MKKHHEQNIPIKMIQKPQIQSAISNLMLQILPDDNIVKILNSLNSNSMVHKWVKDYIKYDGHNVEPIQIFPPGSGGTCKSHLVKVIYNAISKTSLYHCKDLKKREFCYLDLQEYQQEI